VQREIEQRNPLGIGTPDDIAHAAVFLASDESRYATGAPFLIDGGSTSAGPSLIGAKPFAAHNSARLMNQTFRALALPWHLVLQLHDATNRTCRRVRPRQSSSKVPA
jgi:hypothetical protein